MFATQIFIFQILFFQISFVFRLVGILFSVIFVTLLERKVLRYTQTRVGPNKIRILGIFQPLLDGIKLFLKEIIFFSFTNKLVFCFGPVIFFGLIIVVWTTIRTFKVMFSFSFSVVVLIICVGLGVYTTLVSGWGRNSKFRVIGSVRSIAQTISYEIGLSLIFFLLIVILRRFSLQTFNKFSTRFFPLIFFPIFLIWLITIVAECNRAPFDFAEGERELVSGFNTEYASSLFAFLFIGEYGIIIFFSILSCVIFFSLKGLILLIIFFILNFILFIRRVFPRFRYDKLIFLSWFKFLPVTVIFSIFCLFRFFIY